MYVRDCLYCSKPYEYERDASKFCSPKCRKAHSRKVEIAETPEEKQAKRVRKKLGFDIDRTLAFTPEQQEQVNKLEREDRYWAMARPNSAETMTQEERDKHYKSMNYPEAVRVKAGENSYHWR
jgi:hypothetical protein